MSPPWKRACHSSGGFFDVPSLKSQLAALESRMAESSFWDDSQKAQKVIGEANALKGKLDPLQSLTQKVADLKTLTELTIEDASEQAQRELQSEYDATAKELDALELRVLLGGPMDRNNAIISLHSGAG